MVDEPTSVVHLRRAPFDIRIDRKTRWGNPFRMTDESMRAEVIAKFEHWARHDRGAEAQWVRDHVSELRGKVLGCWCAPKPCHGDVLARMATEGRGGTDAG